MAQTRSAIPMHTESSGYIAGPGACGCRWGMGGVPGLQAASPQEMEEQDMTDTSFHRALLWPLPAELQAKLAYKMLRERTGRGNTAT